MAQGDREGNPRRDKEIATSAPIPLIASDRDWLLQALLNLMSSLGFSADVTLLYGGALVSGTPVSERAYFDALGAAFRTGLGGKGTPNSPRPSRNGSRSTARPCRKPSAGPTW